MYSKLICTASLIILSVFLITSCNKTDTIIQPPSTDTTLIPPVDTTNKNPVDTSVKPIIDSALSIEPTGKQIASLLVNSTDFAYWNSTSPNNSAAQPKLKALTKRIYNKFKDDFDFIVFIMNNDEIPAGTAGEFSFVKNDVQGIGLSMFDSTASFGSAGKLQGVYFLYKKKYLSTTLYGPILHEMSHRWANWVVPTTYGGHWGSELNITGQLNSVSANFADIELYLMGMIDANEIKDSASLAAYNKIPAASKTRIPNAANAQHSFKSLLVIMTPQPLTSTEITDFNNGATLITRTDNPASGTNFRKMTKGLGTLTVGELDKSLK